MLIDLNTASKYFFDLDSPANFNNERHKKAASKIISNLLECEPYLQSKIIDGNPESLIDLFKRADAVWVDRFDNKHSNEDASSAMFLLGRLSGCEGRIWFLRLGDIEAYWNVNVEYVLCNLALAMNDLK